VLLSQATFLIFLRLVIKQHCSENYCHLYNKEKSIIKALAYFNVFDYPLNKEEIYNFMDTPCDKITFEKALLYLCRQQVVYKHEEFYSLEKNNRLIEKRKKGNRLAIEQLRIAQKIARFLYRFPFVKGIAVSGSLSKNYADEKSDIDFFIITAKNRLWIARTILHVFKKLSFLTGKQHWFCMNYFIDESALEIKEKNIFTAVEIATVLPMQGELYFKNFILKNKWVKDYFPLHLRWKDIIGDSKDCSINPVRQVKKNGITDKLNEWLMNVTEKRWRIKAAKKLRSYSGELMGLDAGLHYAKPDPSNLQRKILYRYEKEIDAVIMGLESLKAV
jgi:predicted nucleotidyltransferase